MNLRPAYVVCGLARRIDVGSPCYTCTEYFFSEIYLFHVSLQKWQNPDGSAQLIRDADSWVHLALLVQALVTRRKGLRQRFTAYP